MSIYYTVAKDGSISFQDYGFKISGTVPRSITRKGAHAVYEYVLARTEAENRDHKIQQTELEKLKKARRTVNHPVSILYDGINLRGTIIEADQWNFEVRLDEPFPGMIWKAVNPCARDLDNDVNFDDGGCLTDIAILGASQALISLYKNACHRKRHRKSYEVLEQLKNINR